MKKTALINGITGQDGSYLARHLLGLGYRVIGLSRKITGVNIRNLELLQISSAIELINFDVHDIQQVKTLIQTFKPDEIYDLSGQTSVARSFAYPEETRYSIIHSVNNWLDAILYSGCDTKFFCAASSDCFGNTLSPATEETSFNPLSPYAEAKEQAVLLVEEFSKKHGLFCVSGIIFNHESILRSETYFSKKIVNGALQIANGSLDRLELGTLSFSRDWGWAPEYVEAMHLMLQATYPEEYIIATGLTVSAREFLDYAFSKYGLNWEDYCVINDDLKRPQDISLSLANPIKAANQLGWRATTDVYGVIDKMTDYVKNIHYK